jgi:formate/nitrite transporter
MLELFGSDAYAPKEIALKVETVGVAKAQMATLPLIMLGLLAGAFIGLGGLFFVIVKSDSNLSFAVSQLLGGFVFCLGLILVVIAGAELFTGNNLLAMAWADGQITSRELLRNWLWVCAANFVGTTCLALLVYLSGHTHGNGGAIGLTVLKMALAKQNLLWHEAFLKGVLCNVLVCMAVWMSMAGRSVMDKVIAIVFPITAFVAAGFEHSIANMYFMQLALIIQYFEPGTASSALGLAGNALSVPGMFSSLVPVILGNLVGGSVFVGLVYHLIYRVAVAPQPNKPPLIEKN